MSLATQVSALATRMATEFNSVRSEMAASGGGGQIGVPAYAPTLAGNWDVAESSYNIAPSNMHKRQAKYSAAAFNTAALHLGWLGDSTLIGYNGATYSQKQSIPWRHAMAVARLLGHPYPTTGWTLACAASGSLGDRWTTTGTWTLTNCMIAGGAGTATYASPDQCNAIQIAYGNAGTSFTYKVDGEATSRTVTTSGLGTVGILTITALQNGTALAHGFHSVVITAAASCVLVAARCYNSTINQIHVHNLALGGANANVGADTINYSSQATSPAYGLGAIVSKLITAAALSVDDLGVVCGNNDLYSGGGTPATIKTGLQTMLTGFLTPAASFLVHPMMIPGTNSANFDTLSGDFFSLADTNNVPFLSWDEFVGRQANYTADVQYGADSIHPIYSHQNMIATWIANRLVRRMWLGESQWPGVIGLPGGRYKVTEIAGVYAPRPNVPAGFVDYEGADSPVDSLAGDTFLDLP